MTLEQQLSGLVLKNPEQELIDIIASKNVVIMINNPDAELINYLVELMQDNEVRKAWVCNDYVESILYALNNEVNELVFLNKSAPVIIKGEEYNIGRRKIERGISKAINDSIVKQVREYCSLCPISIIDINDYPIKCQSLR
jgi:hypothetical protein